MGALSWFTVLLLCYVLPGTAVRSSARMSYPVPYSIASRYMIPAGVFEQFRRSGVWLCPDLLCILLNTYRHVEMSACRPNSSTRGSSTCNRIIVIRTGSF